MRKQKELGPIEEEGACAGHLLDPPMDYCKKNYYEIKKISCNLNINIYSEKKPEAKCDLEKPVFLMSDKGKFSIFQQRHKVMNCL